MGRWLTCVWDSDNLKKEVMSFGEVEFSSELWKELSAIETVIFQTCKKLGITSDKAKWTWGSTPVEAWSSMGELTVEVPEHGRVLSALFTMIIDKPHTRENIRGLMVRGINDLTVLRKLRLLQMTLLTKCPRIKMVYSRTSRDMEGEMDGYTTVTEEQFSGKQSVAKVDGSMRMRGSDDVTTLSQRQQ